MKASINIIVN